MNPAQRIPVSSILESLAAIAESSSYNLRAPLNIQPAKQLNPSPPNSNSATASSEFINGKSSARNSPNHTPPPQRPAPPSVMPANHISRTPPPQRPPPTNHRAAPPPRPAQQPVQRPPEMTKPQSGSSGLFSSFKGGAGSFLKNLKDTSSKVMQTMQQ